MQKKKWKTIWRSNSHGLPGKLQLGPWFWLVTVIVFCNLYVFRLAVIYGSSMEPALYQNDIVLVWQLGYVPHNGDIIVTNNDNSLEQCLVKRVIATEGQSISISEGNIWVDNIQLEETYTLNNKPLMSDMTEFLVPENTVFLMGDNRNASIDSRTLGCIPEEQIIGKVLVRLFSLP